MANFYPYCLFWQKWPILDHFCQNRQKSCTSKLFCPFLSKNDPILPPKMVKKSAKIDLSIFADFSENFRQIFGKIKNFTPEPQGKKSNFCFFSNFSTYPSLERPNYDRLSQSRLCWEIWFLKHPGRLRFSPDPLMALKFWKNLRIFDSQIFPKFEIYLEFWVCRANARHK